MFRNKFPYFRNDNPIYFDNASTTQKPDLVINEVQNYFKKASNIGRSSYSLANKTTEKIKKVRSKVANFINSKQEEIIFTSGATQSLNMIPDLLRDNIKDGSTILISEDSHKSTHLPWIKLKKELANSGKNIELVEYEVLPTGDPDISDVLDKVDSSTFLISLTHIHNVYGAKTEVTKLINKLDKKQRDKPLISLDACQSIAHVPVDVNKMNIDFLSFSGHKMFASTGCGILYIDEKLHDKVKKHYLGGGINKDCLPHKLERGTLNISGILALGKAIDFIQNIGIKKIKERNLELTNYLIKNLDVNFSKGPAYSTCNTVGYGIISFTKKDVSARDLSFILDSNDIFIRAGGHCSANENSTVRVSLQFYNTKEEIDTLTKIIN